MVLVLFIVIAVTLARIIRANTDPFARITTSAVLVWIVGQAFINIGVVLGILPVLGVPLPLISAGGSSLVTTLVAIGIVLSFARVAPEPLEGNLATVRGESLRGPQSVARAQAVRRAQSAARANSSAQAASAARAIQSRNTRAQ